MSLFKPFKGHRSGLDAVAKKDGNAYFCVDDGSFWIDYTDADGVLQRKQINAADAETLSGMTLDEILANIPDDVLIVPGGATATIEDIFGAPPYTIEFTDEVEELSNVTVAAGSDYSTYRLRNVAIVTEVPTTMNDGDIALVISQEA